MVVQPLSAMLLFRFYTRIQRSMHREVEERTPAGWLMRESEHANMNGIRFSDLSPSYFVISPKSPSHLLLPSWSNDFSIFCNVLIRPRSMVYVFA